MTKGVLSVYSLFIFALRTNYPGIISTVCAQGNLTSSKIGATVVLRAFLGYPIDVNAIPFGDMRSEDIERVVPVEEDVKMAQGVQAIDLPDRV